MSTLALAAYMLLGVGIVLWVLTAGADFGGGLWDLVVRGPHRADDREAISRAIAPIWEANHVWLIFVVVILFSAFPSAFSTVGVALHVPLVVGLVGIVLRGSAFTFRAYGLARDRERRAYGRVFGAASLVTPIAFGAALAATATSQIRVVGEGLLGDSARAAGGLVGQVVAPPLSTWLSPFAALTGLFALALFALVAAAHLAADASHDDVRARFRRRVVVVEGVAFVLAMAVLVRARSDAPELFDGLLRSPFSWPLQIGTAGAAVGACLAFWRARDAVGRALVVVQVTLVVVGFGAAMGGALVLPDVTMRGSAAPDAVLGPIVVVVALGIVALVPALAWLYRLARARAHDADAH